VGSNIGLGAAYPGAARRRARLSPQMVWGASRILSGDSKVSNRPAYLDRPVNKRAPVNGENGEFGGFREAHEPNHDGSARCPVGAVSNRRTAPKRKYWLMFGITRMRKRRCRQANRGGGKLWFWGVAPRRGRVSNFCGLSAAGDPGGLPADSTACDRLSRAPPEYVSKGLPSKQLHLGARCFAVLASQHFVVNGVLTVHRVFVV